MSETHRPNMTKDDGALDTLTNPPHFLIVPRRSNKRMINLRLPHAVPQFLLLRLVFAPSGRGDVPTHPEPVEV